MSWYKIKTNNIISQQREGYKKLFKGNTSSEFYKKAPSKNIQSIITFNFTILDMTSEEDYKVISQSLLKLPGVITVKPYQKSKRLTLSYNPYMITLEHIVFEILRLGYRYFLRA